MKRTRLLLLVLALVACRHPTIRLRDHADPERLRSMVVFLADSLHGRNAEQISNLERAAARIRAEFASFGVACESQDFPVGGGTYRNIFCKVQGESDSVFVVGAHYDTYRDFPGADDNASGVAGLVETARLVSKGPKAPYTTVFVAFALEEPPYFRTANMGSSRFASWIKASRWPVVGMASLEMIGFYTDSAIQRYPTFFLGLVHPSEGNFVASVSNLQSSDLADEFQQNAMALGKIGCEQVSTTPNTPGVDFSDHLNFWNNGYEAFMVTNTALFRNHRYHSKADVPGTLDYDRMGYVVDAMANFLLDKR